MGSGENTQDSEVDPQLIDALGMRARSSDVALAPGEVLNETYRIERRLGAGGMGVVYLARDLRLQRAVAIKLHRERTGDSDGARLLREATAMAQLVHPNVATVYQVGTWSGRSYIAMEYVDGGTLREWLAASRTPREILGRFVEAGRGLAAAHAIGIVHRDFKPDNVLIGRDGRVRVSDFGVARVADAVVGPADPDPSPVALAFVTEVGAVMGTPGYMAPEQRDGGTPGPPADQFAFAIALWEALAGQRPDLESGTPAPPPPGRLAPRVHAALTRALANNPEDRFPTIDALLRELTHDPRRWRVFAVIGGLAVVTIAIAVALLMTSDPAWQPRVQELLPAFDEHTTYPSISPDGSEVAFASNRERANHYRIYIAPLRGGAARAVTPPEMNAVAVRWMHDRRSLLVTTRSGTVFGFPLDGGTPTELGTTFAEAVDDCGGGRVLLVPRELPGCPTCTALVLRAPDGSVREVHRSAPGEVIIRAACDREGRRIVFSSSGVVTAEPPTDLWLLTIDGGPPRRLTNDAAYNLTPVFHPDGKSVIFSSMRGGKRNLWELALDSGELLQLTAGEGPDIGPAISPDGQVLIFNVDITSFPLTANVEGTTPRRITGRVDLDQPRATPKADEVLAEENERTGKRIVAVNVVDGTIRDLVAGSHPAVTRDGREVVYATEPERRSIRALARSNGASREIGAAPGVIEAIDIDFDDWVHLAVRTDSAVEAWRIPLAGGAVVRDAPAPWVFVKHAPIGGWRAFFRLIDATRREIRLVPPGESPDGTGGFTIRAVELDWYPSGAAVVYFDPPWVRRLDLRTGEETRLFEAGEYAVLTAGTDGHTIYSIDRDSQVRRMAITNFGARPRP